MSHTVASVDPAVVVIEEAIVLIVREATLPSVQERFVAQSGVALERAAYGVVREVADCGAVRLTDLANSLGLDLSTVSRQVKGLEAAGLLARTEDPDDRRAAWVTTSRDGAEALDRLARVRHRFFEDLLARWPQEDRDRLAPLRERFARELRQLGGRP